MLDFRHIRYVDVHPTEPWILMAQDGGHVSIWNYQTQERVMKLEVTRVHTPATLSRWARGSTSDHWWFVFCPKFIAREQWFAAGDTDGWVRVYSYTTMDKVMEFKAHDEPVCLLCVHPTRPLLLTATHNDEWIKLWDWSKNRKFENKFNTQRHGSERLMWHPRDTNIFASVSTSNVKVWEIRSSHPTATLKGAKKGCYLYTESNRHLMVTLTSDWRTSEKDTSQIWDLQTEECVHKLGLSGSGIIDDIACHPTLPILATRGTARTVCLWDARPTYR
jgi:coatomer subunit beta'